MKVKKPKYDRRGGLLPPVSVHFSTGQLSPDFKFNKPQRDYLPAVINRYTVNVEPAIMGFQKLLNRK